MALEIGEKIKIEKSSMKFVEYCNKLDGVANTTSEDSSNWLGHGCEMDRDRRLSAEVAESDAAKPMDFSRCLTIV